MPSNAVRPDPVLHPGTDPALQHHRVRHDAEHHADNAGDPEATNSFERPERIAARSSTIEKAGPKFSYIFPAYSVTLIKLLVQEDR